MCSVRRLFVLLLIVSSLVLLAACQEGSSSSAGSRTIAKNFQWQPLFGDGTNDASGVIALVGDFEITARDLELYREELPAAQETTYQGPTGERLLLKRMVDNVLMARAAVTKGLYNDPDVARTIIAKRRDTLVRAMLNYGLLRDRKPSDEEVREYFMNNRSKYRQLGIVNARHIECLTKDAAEKAYQRLVAGGKRNDWMSVMVEMSVNEESKVHEGSVGWFNQDATIPFIKGSMKFINEVFDLEIGLHPPFRILDQWHVVEILKRVNERPSTFSEVKATVELEMMPIWQEAIIRDFLLEARKQHNVEMLGEFAPGRGLSVDELFARAMAVSSVDRKIELLDLVYSDYPESDRGDDALFMAANIVLEARMDTRNAERYLLKLLEEYPDSELAEDAKFLKDNLHNPEVLNPKSIEELRKNIE